MKRRIMGVLLATTTVATLLLALPLSVAFGRHYRDEATFELEQHATLAAALIPDNFASGAAVKLPPTEASISLGLYARDGRRVAGAGPDLADLPVTSALRGVAAARPIGRSLVAAVPVGDDLQVVGAVRAAEPTAESSARAQKASLRLAGIAAAVVVLAGLVALGLSSRLARPLLRLRDAAVRLGDGDFSIEAQRSGVAELDELDAALAATARRLGDLVARERAFSEDVSHQLQTPITSMSIAIESALDCPPEDLRPVLEDVMHDIGRLEATVVDLLALARDQPSDRGPLDVGALVDSLSSGWSSRLWESGRRLRVAVEQSLPAAHASGAAVGQALNVLVDNAVVHGSGTVTIEARMAQPSGIVVSVADEGRGVAEPARIFQRCSGNGTGHGIGLALARALVEGEGGRLLLAYRGPRPVFELLVPTRQERSTGQQR